uniref:Anthranilate synthase component 2 n=1 Tax=Sphondylothamnion multifidum TaxID=193186 RepID=A0A4D6WY86_9FLOR|nr:Anthranilate synthase component II [Sphondylothamnion multifidum]
MILIIDNYDSFTQNLAQYIGEIGLPLQIIRNDHNIKDISKIQPTHIIISPGPGHPKESGISLDIIKHYSPILPILGVCLGHQCIGHIYGGEIKELNIPMHGKVSKIIHKNIDIFYGLSNPFNATRYHSLIINNKYLPEELEITAWTEEGLIMGCRHKQYKKLRGVQFHPESIWTNEGKKLIHNFVCDNMNS